MADRGARVLTAMRHGEDAGIAGRSSCPPYRDLTLNDAWSQGYSTGRDLAELQSKTTARERVA